MYVRRVELADFRSFERVAVDLDPGVSVLVGQNGMGKTNLVEAIGFVGDEELLGERAGQEGRVDPVEDVGLWVAVGGEEGDGDSR